MDAVGHFRAINSLDTPDHRCKQGSADWARCILANQVLACRLEFSALIVWSSWLVVAMVVVVVGGCGVSRVECGLR